MDPRRRASRDGGPGARGDTLTQKLWVNPHYRNGAELEAVQRAELAHWEPIIRSSGFKPE